MLSFPRTPLDLPIIPAHSQGFQTYMCLKKHTHAYIQHTHECTCALLNVPTDVHEDNHTNTDNVNLLRDAVCVLGGRESRQQKLESGTSPHLQN